MSYPPRFMLITVANLLFVLGAANQWGLRVNTTASYPAGIYRATGEPWGRWDLVEACLPPEIAKFAVERGYLKSAGRCDRHPSIIKRVYGMGGDQVDVNTVVSVNGVAVSGAVIRTHDPMQRPLVAASGGQLASDEVWLMSVSSPLSFDSRYFGAVPEQLVSGALEPVWLFGSTTVE